MNKLKCVILLVLLSVFTYVLWDNLEREDRTFFLANQIKHQDKWLEYIDKIDYLLNVKGFDIVFLKDFDTRLVKSSEKIKDYNSSRALELKIVLEYFRLRIWRQIDKIEENQLKEQEKLEKEKRRKLSEKVKSVYYTTYSATSKKKIDYLIELAKNKEINSVTIDIKNVNWYVAFDMSDYSFDKIKPVSNDLIKNPKDLVKKLHDNWIYVIARVVVFKDKSLSERRPDLAIKWTTDYKTVWSDYKWNKYLDPYSKEVWNYNANIASAAYKVWFDEINFDYVRFPTDWYISKTYYPFAREILNKDYKYWKIKVIDKFSYYITSKLRKENPGIILSADVFWLVTKNDLLQIGQNLESFLLNFDFVWPMIYPSHYWANFLWFKQPDNYPYEVFIDALKKSKEKIDKLNQEIKLSKIEERKIKINSYLTSDVDNTKLEEIKITKIRSWLQWFSCTRCVWATPYNRVKFRKQITALEEYGINSWWVWSSSSRYYYDRYNKD